MPAEFKNIVIDNAILTNVEYSASKDVTAALQSAFTSAQAGITGTADKTGLITYWTCTNGIKLFIIDTGRFNAAFGDISFGIQKSMQFDFHYGIVKRTAISIHQADNSLIRDICQLENTGVQPTSARLIIV